RLVRPEAADVELELIQQQRHSKGKPSSPLRIEGEMASHRSLQACISRRPANIIVQDESQPDMPSSESLRRQCLGIGGIIQSLPLLSKVQSDRNFFFYACGGRIVGQPVLIKVRPRSVLLSIDPRGRRDNGGY